MTTAVPTTRRLGFTTGQHLAAMALFAVVTFAFFLPLVRGDTFSDVAARQQGAFPWEGLPDEGRTFRLVHSDQADSFYPWQVFMNRSLRHGELPLWNPYSFGGAPFFANGQSGVLYPPRLALALTVSPARVHDLLLATHLFGAGVAMFLLLGFLRLAFPAAVLGGLTWMLNSFALAWQALEHYTAIEVWMPIGVLLAHATVRRRSWPAAFALALVLALLFLGGNVLFAELAIAAIFGYGVALAIADRRRGRQTLRESFLRLTTAAVLLVGLVSVSLLPTLALTSESARASLSYHELADFALPWDALRYVFLPPPVMDFFDPYHRALFAGTVVGALALVGLLRREACARLAAVLAFLTILFMVHTPVTFVAIHVLPGLDSLKPLPRAAFLLQFALAVLAAYGFDTVVRRLSRLSPRRLPRLGTSPRPLLHPFAAFLRLPLVPALAGVLLGLVAGGLTILYGRSHLGFGTAAVVAVAAPPAAALAFELGARQSARRLAGSPLLAGSLCGAVTGAIVVRSLGSLAALVAGVALALAGATLVSHVAPDLAGRLENVARSRPVRRSLTGAGLAMALAGVISASIVVQEGWWAHYVMLHQPNEARYLYPETPLIQHLEERREERFLPIVGSFVGSTAMIYRLQSAGGYESLLPGRVQNLWRVIGNGFPPSALASYPQIYAYHPQFNLLYQRPALLARAGVDNIVAPPRLGRERPPGGLKAAWVGRDGRVFPIAGVLPRAYYAPGCDEVGTPFAALQRFVSRDFRAGRTVVVERPFLREAGLSCAAGSPRGDGSATIVERSLNSLLVRVDASRPGWLVVNESWDRGWNATIDGRDTDVLPGNYAFRTVRVPAGTHDLHFVYRPALFEAGVAISGGSLAVTLVGLVLVPLLRRRRSPRSH